MGSDEIAGGWMRAIPLAELPERKAKSVQVGETEVLLYRMGDSVLAAANRCTHQGAPLDRGVVKVAGSLKTVVCPLHGSTFLLTDGRVLRGPATVRLPIFDARIDGDLVEVRPHG
ncbi:MAG: Rieske (2Fe-2S) protein [Actinomycetota bacterium]|nr:Rieske (2Fe-2S) protein [Actinomycetota bacterium]